MSREIKLEMITNQWKLIKKLRLLKKGGGFMFPEDMISTAIVWKKMKQIAAS